MKKVILILVFSLVLTSFIFSINPVEIEDLSRPSIFIVKNDRVYVMEKTTVFIYSLKGFKLIGQFGKPGEGPGELKHIPNDRPMNLFFTNGDIAINSLNKLSFFTDKGVFKKEMKLSTGSLLFPLKNDFLGIGPILAKDKKFYMGFRLYDKEFTGKKVLFESDFEVRNPKKLLMPVISFTYHPLYKGNIYINSSSKDFKIDVFSFSGEKKYTIKKDYKQIPVPSTYPKEITEWFKTSPVFKRQYEYIKKILKFRSYYPAIRDLQIVDDIIYVITYKMEKGKTECILLDLKGKEIKRLFVQLNKIEPFSFFPLLYSVHKGKFYSLIEDEDDEVWKVHSMDLKLKK